MSSTQLSQQVKTKAGGTTKEQRSLRSKQSNNENLPLTWIISPRTPEKFNAICVGWSRSGHLNGSLSHWFAYIWINSKQIMAALGAKSAGRATEPAICRTLIRLVSCRKRTWGKTASKKPRTCLERVMYSEEEIKWLLQMCDKYEISLKIISNSSHLIHKYQCIARISPNKERVSYPMLVLSLPTLPRNQQLVCISHRI